MAYRITWRIKDKKAREIVRTFKKTKNFDNRVDLYLKFKMIYESKTRENEKSRPLIKELIEEQETLNVMRIKIIKQFKEETGVLIDKLISRLKRNLSL